MQKDFPVHAPSDGQSRQQAKFLVPSIPGEYPFMEERGVLSLHTSRTFMDQEK